MRENVSFEYSILLLVSHGIEVEPIALNRDNAGMLCFVVYTNLSAVCLETGQTLALASVCDKYTYSMGRSHFVGSSELVNADEVDECFALVGSEVEGEIREKLASLLDFLAGEALRKFVAWFT